MSFQNLRSGQNLEKCLAFPQLAVFPTMTKPPKLMKLTVSEFCNFFKIWQNFQTRKNYLYYLFLNMI